MRLVAPRIAGLDSAASRAILSLTAVMALDTADQSAIGATAPEVRHAFHISQTAIGVLATSSTLVGVLFTLPFGILADRRNRVRLLKLTVIGWTLGSLAVAASPDFGIMLLAHSVLGLVTGAAGPLIASLVGDLTDSAERGRVYSSLLVGELAGSALGLSISGEVAAFAGWRWAFLVLSAIGMSVWLMLSGLTEPARTPPERVPGGRDLAELGLLPAAKLLFAIRTNLLLVVASALGYYFFAGVQTFAVSLLTDAYGVSEEVAPLLVLLVGGALAVGVVVGGPVADRLMERESRYGRLPLVMIAFAGSLMFVVPALSISHIVITMPLLVAGGVLLGAANPALDATRIDIVPSRLLGRAEALRTALRDGADAVAPLAFGSLGARIGLRQTFVAMTASLGLAFGLGLLSLRSYPNDVSTAAAYS